LTATAVKDVALFAGGTTAALHYAENEQALRVVDIFNATSGMWSTAALSASRLYLAATTVKDVALFAGGNNATSFSNVVDIYNATSGNWTTATLSAARTLVAATAIGDVAVFAGGFNASGGGSQVVDIFNATTGMWSTASLSVSQGAFAASSVGNVALFAGGATEGAAAGIFSGSGGGSALNVVGIYNPSPQQPPPNILLITHNVVANFSNGVPTIKISAPLIVNSTLSSGHIGLEIMFDQTVGCTTASNTISSESNYTVTNASDATLTRYIYQSHLVNANNATQGLLNQVFSFSNTSQQAYSTLVVLPAAVKWSLQINASAPFQDGLSMSFSLSDLSSLPMTTAPVTNSIVHFTAVPYGGSNITRMTTYYLPLFNHQQQGEQGQPVAVLEVLDWAIVDGMLVAINHSVTSVADGRYILVLCFPAFNSTLEYDPSVNLGLLIGHQSTSSSPDLSLIIGTIVGIGGAVVVVVVLVIATAIVVAIVAKPSTSSSKLTLMELKPTIIMRSNNNNMQTQYEDD